ncbi:hypothetical protein BDD12DRAFT_540063 [Trichophaea hybrida]|nr:hypothetical protein BDD12DRAFT_540063 [Trichophaea hybrida]
MHSIPNPQLTTSLPPPNVDPAPVPCIHGLLHIQTARSAVCPPPPPPYPPLLHSLSPHSRAPPSPLLTTMSLSQSATTSVILTITFLTLGTLLTLLYLYHWIRSRRLRPARYRIARVNRDMRQRRGGGYFVYPPLPPPPEAVYLRGGRQWGMGSGEV